jgi:hypothetical protein
MDRRCMSTQKRSSAVSAFRPKPAFFELRSSAMTPAISRLLLRFTGRCTRSPTGTASIRRTGDREQRVVSGFVELEVSTPAPDRGFDLASACQLRETREIGCLGDGAMDQEPAAFARRLDRKGSLEFEVAAGTHHQVGREPQSRAVEGIVVTPPSGKAGHQFALQQVGSARRSREIGPSVAWHCRLRLGRRSRRRTSPGAHLLDRNLGKRLRRPALSQQTVGQRPAAPPFSERAKQG